MTVAIHQPNFLPWIGYFHKILLSDSFVFFDDVQFPRGKSFGYRTSIKTEKGAQWVSVSVANKSEMKNYNQTIYSETDWKAKSLGLIHHNYQSSLFFSEIFPIIESEITANHSSLSELNTDLIIAISRYMKIDTKFHFSSAICDGIDYEGLDKIVYIVQQLNSDIYLSGSGAGSRRYIDESLFHEKQIALEWQEFDIKPYDQQFGDFIPNLSILDLVMNHGPKSTELLLK